MKVCDLIYKMLDHHVDIVITEYKGISRIMRSCVIEKYSNDYTNVPEDIWNAEVDMIMPSCDQFRIWIQAK